MLLGVEPKTFYLLDSHPNHCSSIHDIMLLLLQLLYHTTYTLPAKLTNQRSDFSIWCCFQLENAYMRPGNAEERHPPENGHYCCSPKFLFLGTVLESPEMVSRMSWSLIILPIIYIFRNFREFSFLEMKCVRWIQNLKFHPQNCLSLSSNDIFIFPCLFLWEVIEFMRLQKKKLTKCDPA